MCELKVLDTGASIAKENMRLDAELLCDLDPHGPPILHLYQWRAPSLTYGYFIAPEKYLNLEKVQQQHLQIARRPTGGGIVFHIWDLAFSFLMPAGHRAFSLNTLENYRFVNGAVLEAVSSLLSLQDIALTPVDGKEKSAACRNFCMAKPTRYDLLYQGKKIAGAAQRRNKRGYLHQGTISLASPQVELLEELLLKKSVLQAMIAYTFAPLGRIWEAALLHETRQALQKLLVEKLGAKLSS